MTKDTFFRRIDSKKTNHYGYSRDGLVGRIAVWRYEGEYVLLWEEFPEGEVHDESQYTRDEQRGFNTAGELLEFLSSNQIDVERFHP